MKKMLLASVILLGLVGCEKTGENDYLLKYETTDTNTHTVVIKKGSQVSSESEEAILNLASKLIEGGR